MQLSIDYVSVAGGQRHVEGGSRQLALAGKRSRSSQSSLRLAASPSKRCGIVIADSQGLLRLKPGKAKLAILAEPDVAGGIEAGPLVADWISAEFDEDRSSSIVTSLSNALHTAHRRLARENHKSVSAERRGVAVVCASARDDDLYLAQVGPSLALRFRNDQLGLVGQDFVPGTITFAGCLGQDCEIEVRLAHEPLRHGDVIILCTPSLIDLASESEDKFTECFRRESSQEIVNALFHLYQVSLTPVDFAAIVIVAQADALEAKELEVTELEESEGKETETNMRAAPPDGGGQPHHERQRAEPTGHQRSQAQARPRTRADAQTPSHSQVQDQSMSQAGAGSDDDGSRRAPSAAESPNRRKMEKIRKLDLKRMLVFAFLPLLILSIVSSCAFFVFRDREAKERYAQAQPLIAKMAESEREAQSAENVMMKRRLLSQAEDYAAQALGARPDDPAIRSDRERIRRELDQLSNVVRLPSAQELVDLAQQAKDADPTHMIVQGNDIFALDRGADRLYRYSLDPSGGQIQNAPDSVVARGKEKIGNSLVGYLTAMAWVPAGGQRLRSALVFSDDGGNLFEYDPTKGLAPLKSAAQAWPSRAQALGGYAGSVFVLAPKSGQLVWFPPTPHGYEKPPFAYVNPESQVDLSTAVDFAVDASLYVLHSTGKIERFTAGRPQQFDSSAPDVPLRSPLAIFASPSARSIYVVDSANQRVVQFSKDGHFERQFRYGGADNLFNSLRSVSVDEQRKKLYFLSGKKIFVADIPE